MQDPRCRMQEGRPWSQGREQMSRRHTGRVSGQRQIKERRQDSMFLTARISLGAALGGYHRSATWKSEAESPCAPWSGAK